jgi:hypothetical protein
VAERLFAEGKSISDVASEMGRAASTVTTYLTDYLVAKRVVDPSPWVEPKDQQDVEAAIEVLGSRPLKPLFDHLQGRVNYDVLRIVATCWENRKQG